jgi:4-hydroxy-3-methylbut-2-en-1-yl diphosphate synthase IspG/GcpE
METKHCTCGAEVEVRRSIRRTADGSDEVVYRVSCPVCGQLGPAVPVANKDEDIAIAEAIQAWNEMIARR